MNRNVPWNWLNITKLVITHLLIILSIIDIGMALNKDPDIGIVNPVDYWTPIIKVLTFVSELHL